MRHGRVAGTAKAPVAGRARLNLAPRLRPDETLSSWLERCAGAYGLTLPRFLRWLGYSERFSAAWSRIDLDVAPPIDLATIMASHTGLAPEAIEARRLPPEGALPLHLRRTFCPQCWREEGPYRRCEWASGWSLICTRHRSLLREKPPFDLSVKEVDQSWLEFYETRALWQDQRPCWESPSWITLCAALGVEPRTQATRAYFWLRDLQRLASGRAGPSRPTDEPADCRSRSVPEPLAGTPLKQTWRVKRDLVLYGLLKFSGPSLLETLDPKLSVTQLIDTAREPEICTLAKPDAGYAVRLFAAVVAEHLWGRLTRGRWRCQHAGRIEAVVSGQNRSSAEDFWISRRVHYWPAALQRAGRELFGTPDGWAGMPPWAPCRDCVRALPRADRKWLAVQLDDDWQCSREAPDNAWTKFIAAQGPSLPAGWGELWWKR